MARGVTRNSFFIGTVLYITIKSHTVAAALSRLLCYWVARLLDEFNLPSGLINLLRRWLGSGFQTKNTNTMFQGWIISHVLLYSALLTREVGPPLFV